MEKTPMRVKLVSVLGDQEEFADLIGTEGDLTIRHKTGTFNPDNRGDWLVMEKKRWTRRNGMVKISTILGNTFIFRELEFFTKKS
jgi:hypothetical protein